MPTDTIRIMCPNLSCRKILGVPATARGKTVKCRVCSTSIRVPEDAGKRPSAKAAPPSD